MQRAPSRSGERILLRSQRQNRIPIRSKLKCGFDLFQLPDDFVVDVLEGWLECEHLLPLDDALCCKEQRIKYLRLITMCKYAAMGWSSTRTFCADLVLRWCRLRHLPVYKLHASSLFMRRGSFPWTQYQPFIKNLTSVHGTIDTSLMDAWLCDILVLVPDLQDLHIITKGSAALSSRLFRIIARHCRALLELRLFNLTSTLSPPVGPIVRNCSKLTTLEVFHCIISDADATHLSVDLAHLYITNRESENTLSAAFARQVAHRCPLLETLSIEQGWGSETIYTPYILRTVGAKLKHLCSITAEVARWSPLMFAALTAGCTQLREVSLCGCSTMPVDVIHDLLFIMPHLSSLTLSGHSAYNGQLGESALRCGSSIQYLSLIEFTALTNRGAANLLRFCPNLQALSFSSVPLINLQILDILVLYCKEMERVYFARCPTRPYTLAKKSSTLNFNYSVEIIDPRFK